MAASLRFGWPELHQLGNFTTPAFVIHGTADLVLPTDHAEALAAGIQGSDLLLIEGMGHLPTPSEWTEIARPVSARLGEPGTSS